MHLTIALVNNKEDSGMHNRRVSFNEFIDAAGNGNVLIVNQYINLNLLSQKLFVPTLYFFAKPQDLQGSFK